MPQVPVTLFIMHGCGQSDLNSLRVVNYSQDESHHFDRADAWFCLRITHLEGQAYTSLEWYIYSGLSLSLTYTPPHTFICQWHTIKKLEKFTVRQV